MIEHGRRSVVVILRCSLYFGGVREDSWYEMVGQFAIDICRWNS